MTAKTMSAQADQKPNAWICNTRDRGRKSVKSGNKIYLQDGQNFEIELFNPLTESVLADIRINSKSVSSGGLVIRPGERAYLDCFVDDKKKFIFKTYQIENTEESKKAAANNGMIEVFFYKEETPLLRWNTLYPVYYHASVPYPVYQNWNYYPYWNYPYYTYGGNGTVTIGSTTFNGNITNTGSYTNTSGNSISCNTSFGDITFGNSQQIGNYCCDTSSIDLSNLLGGDGSSITMDGMLSGSSQKISNNIETGRVEKGESSSQKFAQVDMNFEKYYISNVSYQILPESQRPIETKELVKCFCDSCGCKCKSTSNYCSSCGNKLK